VNSPKTRDEPTISDDRGWNPIVKPLNTLGPLLAQRIASSITTLTKACMRQTRG
jgi:hypothetical protein